MHSATAMPFYALLWCRSCAETIVFSLSRTMLGPTPNVGILSRPVGSNGSSAHLYMSLMTFWILHDGMTFHSMMSAFSNAWIRQTLNAQRYCDAILRPVVVSFMRINNRFLFEQDNARPHTARLFHEFCTGQHVNTLPWPSRSNSQSSGFMECNM
jgi:hypothetical protein